MNEGERSSGFLNADEWKTTSSEQTTLEEGNRMNSGTNYLMGGAFALLAGALMATTAMAQVADMPRNETLVLTPWGDQPAQFANVDNWHPYLTSVT
ncbi:MAG: hypothetical protein EOP18_06995, partial [Rhizobiaceae bacterium]